MPTTTVRNIDLILVGSLGKETLANDAFQNLAVGISGPVTIALAETDHTLTTDNQGEAMHMIHVLTGSLTANVNVIAPDEGRVFLVDNRTTGAFTVTYKTATGGGVAVPQGDRSFLYCDGIDVFPVGTSGGGGSGGAPTDASYLVSQSHSLLTGERVVTDTATVTWDHATAGQSKAQIPDGALTYAKLQNVTAARLLGRYDAAPGSAQEISLGSGLVLDPGGVLSAPGTGGGAPGGTSGQVQYNNGGAFAGSSGLVLNATQVTAIDLASPLPVTEGGTGAVNATTARSNLGLVIGTNVQAADPTLTALGGVTTGTDTLPYFTGVDAASTTPLTAFARSLLDDADASAGRATLGISTASETVAGIVELATVAEVQGGIDTIRAITPSGLSNRLAIETRTGLIALATPLEANQGTESTKAVTPATLQHKINNLPNATTSTRGLIPLATEAEVLAGVEGSKAVTAATLAARSATESRSGLLSIATQGETTAGSIDTKAVTPLKLQQRLAALPPVPPATETVAGVVELATQAEVNTGTDTARAVTPATLATRLGSLTVPAASETIAGIAELATSAEVSTGTDDSRIVTPLKLQQKFTAMQTGTALSVTRYAASGQALEASPLSVDASGNLRLGSVTPGTNAQRVLAVASGVAPTGSHPGDAVQMWVEDFEGTAGAASLVIRGEQGVLTTIGNGILSRMNPRTVTTNGVTTPLVLTAEMSGKFLLCNNPTEIAGLQLPSPTIGVYYTVVNNQGSPRGTRIMAAAGHTIRLGTVSSAAGGYVQSQSVGDSLVLIGLSGTTWQAINPPPGWTVGV